MPSRYRNFVMCEGLVIIAVANRKGGTAKSTTAVHLGAALAELEHRVLIIDMDSQSHVAEFLGLKSRDVEIDTSDVLAGDVAVADAIVHDVRPNLDILPGSEGLDDMEITLAGLTEREYRLMRAIAPIEEDYDFILIDCPPPMSLLTLNALLASTHVIAPMTPDYAGMEGLAKLIHKVNEIHDLGLNDDLAFLGILPCRVTATVIARETMEAVRKALEDIHIFESEIPETVQFRTALGRGQLLFDFNTHHHGSDAYRQLAKEVSDANRE